MLANALYTLSKVISHISQFLWTLCFLSLLLSLLGIACKSGPFIFWVGTNTRPVSLNYGLCHSLALFPSLPPFSHCSHQTGSLLSTCTTQAASVFSNISCFWTCWMLAPTQFCLVIHTVWKPFQTVWKWNILEVKCFAWAVLFILCFYHE